MRRLHWSFYDILMFYIIQTLYTHINIANKPNRKQKETTHKKKSLHPVFLNTDQTGCTDGLKMGFPT